MSSPTTAPPPPSPPSPSPPAKLAAIWPQPLEIIGVTGPIGSGKTLFGLTIDPRNTLVYDEEKSSKPYESLGFTRIDIHDEMQRQHPRGYRAIDVFTWWWNHAMSVPVGKYSVIMCDTFGLIENGLVDWVKANPGHFGHTEAQHKAKNGAMMWGDAAKHAKIILLAVAARCQTFIYTMHMGRKGDAENAPLVPKGGKTLMELPSLYLQMDLTADAKNRGQPPSATVLKTRLVSFGTDPATGAITTVPTLPPRLPAATPHAIRGYMAAPPEVGRLKPEEQVVEQRMSEDEKLLLRAQAAQAEAEAERLRVERLNRLRAEQGGTATTPVSAPAQAPAQAPAPPPTAPAPSANGTAAAPIRPEQMEELRQLRPHYFVQKSLESEPAQTAEWSRLLHGAHPGATSAKQLTEAEAARLITTLADAVPFLNARPGAGTAASTTA